MCVACVCVCVCVCIVDVNLFEFPLLPQVEPWPDYHDSDNRNEVSDLVYS